MWFLFALITTLAWGAADLFYKGGADVNDKYSHLRTSMTVGVVMGIHAIATLLITGVHFDFRNLLIYLPVSAMYILSMTIGYLGLRYLALSVCSPVQNASGAIVSILCLVFLHQTMSGLSAVGVVLICAGVIGLGIFERMEEKALPEERKYAVGIWAFLFPVIYCIIDALGTFFDAWYLDDFTTTPLLGVTEDSLEIVANASYELTFLFCAIVIFIFLLVKKQPLALTTKKQGSRGLAAIAETLGQFTYVYAMSGNGVVAAPMVASYCVVSVLLSRIFLKEKLEKRQYAVIAVVIAGIILMGIAEGLSE